MASIPQNLRFIDEAPVKPHPGQHLIEVVSDDSADRDWHAKFQEYEASGVNEYWIVDPLRQRLEAFALGDEHAYQRILPHDGKVVSGVVSGFYLRPEWLWQQPFPGLQELLRELLK